MGGISKTKIVLAVVALLVMVSLCFFWFSDDIKHRPPEPVKMTTAELKVPAEVAGKLDVPPRVATQIVKEIQTVEKPIIIYRDVPAAEVPKKITEAAKLDKPDKVVVEEKPNNKDISVYSIHLEKKARFGVYGKMSVSPEVKPVEAGVMLKKEDNLYMLGKDFERNRITASYGRFL